MYVNCQINKNGHIKDIYDPQYLYYVRYVSKALDIEHASTFITFSDIEIFGI